MSLENLKIVLANEGDAKSIHNLIVKRCKWFKENNIKQWELEYYPVYFDDKYFKERASTNNLFMAKSDGKIIGAMLLKEDDKSYWKDDESSYYIHHLVTDIKYKGVGKELINFAINKCIENKKAYLRLDCVKSNIKLNNYYKNLGFENVGSGKEIGYTYNLYELKLDSIFE